MAGGCEILMLFVQEYQGNIKHFIKDGQYQIEILLPIKIGTIPTKEF